MLPENDRFISDVNYLDVKRETITEIFVYREVTINFGLSLTTRYHKQLWTNSLHNEKTPVMRHTIKISEVSAGNGQRILLEYCYNWSGPRQTQAVADLATRHTCFSSP